MDENMPTNISGCIHILTTGQKKGTRCGCQKIYCSRRCLRHFRMIPNNQHNNNNNNNYGNPDQAHLWVQWVMSVNDNVNDNVNNINNN